MHTRSSLCIVQLRKCVYHGDEPVVEDETSMANYVASAAGCTCVSLPATCPGELL